MKIATNGTELHVRVTGHGRPLVLLHGWPHTSRLWDLLPPLDRRVIAPDLRGIGDSAPAEDGFDAVTQAADVVGLLDALGLPSADVAAIDASVPTGFVLGSQFADRVGRLILMEGLLPGGFDQPPWWFGFHSVPGLPETVLAGHEGEYLDFFLRTGSYAGVPPEIRDAFVRAYTGTDRLRRGFGFYRARNEISGKLAVPTVAVGGSVVGDRLHRQLEPLAGAGLRGVVLDRCGHLVPIDRPDALAELIDPS